jgi:hypothetical protein
MVFKLATMACAAIDHQFYARSLRNFPYSSQTGTHEHLLSIMLSPEYSRLHIHSGLVNEECGIEIEIEKKNASVNSNKLDPICLNFATLSVPTGNFYVYYACE